MFQWVPIKSTIVILSLSKKETERQRLYLSIKLKKFKEKYIVHV